MLEARLRSDTRLEALWSSGSVTIPDSDQKGCIARPVMENAGIQIQTDIFCTRLGPDADLSSREISRVKNAKNHEPEKAATNQSTILGVG